MAKSPLILADAFRAEQFHLLGRTRLLLRGFESWTDDNGIIWAVKRVPSYSMRGVYHCFAFTWLGPGWIFDGAAPCDQLQTLADLRAEMTDADPSRSQAAFARVIRAIRLGWHAESLLWAIHRQIIAAQSSVIRMSDRGLAQAIWGEATANWPQNWRQIILSVLAGMTWLHLADGSVDMPPLGETTAILHHTGDLRADTENDVCDEYCPHRHGRRHHHILVNVGKGFLGVLEQFAEDDVATGIRSYHFPVSGRGAAATLRQVGKTGRLVSIFQPAKLGEPCVRQSLTSDQHRLLQAIVRELTRRTKEKRRDSCEPEIFTDGRIRSINGKTRAPCASLPQNLPCVTFGGNNKRKGLGYLLTSEGGWLAKAGYAPEMIDAFLADVENLNQRLGLIPIGVHRQKQHHVPLSVMQSLASSPPGRSELHELHVRFYAAADFQERWSRFFQWASPVSGHASTEPLLALIDSMKRKKITRRALARGVRKDPSFINKILNRQKRPPGGLLEAAQAWVENYDEPTPPSPSVPADHPKSSLGIDGDGTLLSVATDYLQRGWSVVPMKVDKRPHISWKQFQDRKPTEEQLAQWFAVWPNAGLAAVLGPVSNLFVIDVDGPEAHAVLVERMRGEPTAPKAISGSCKPCRYHLYFLHPNIATRAKVTPWHKNLEFRGYGGITVVPPSLHPSGNRYAWVPGQSLDDLALPELPAKIVEALAIARPQAAPCIVAPIDGLDASPSTLRFLSGRYANEPEWNQRLFRAACDLAARDMPLAEAEPLLLAGAGPWNSAETENARRTIASAFSQPREPAFL